MVTVAVPSELNTTVPVKLKLPFLGVSPVMVNVAEPPSIVRQCFLTSRLLTTISTLLLPCFEVSVLELKEPERLNSPLTTYAVSACNKPPTPKIELPELLFDQFGPVNDPLQVRLLERLSGTLLLQSTIKL